MLCALPLSRHLSHLSPVPVPVRMPVRKMHVGALGGTPVGRHRASEQNFGMCASCYIVHIY